MGCGSTRDGHLDPGVLGFLPKISMFWYVGLLLLILGIVLARGKSEPYAMFGLVSLVAAFTLTPALIYGTPRTQSAQKHIDLVQLVLQTHHLDRGADIYQAYSGLFSAMAWVCDLARVNDSNGLATYWPFFIGLIGLAELRFFFGRLSPSAHRIWAAMTLTVLVNSLGRTTSPYRLVSCSAWAYSGWRWTRLARSQRADATAPASSRRLLSCCHPRAQPIRRRWCPRCPGGLPRDQALVGAGDNPCPGHRLGYVQPARAHGFISLSDLGNLSNFTPPKTVSTPGLERLPW